MASSSTEVVIIGGGIVGLATAYLLGRAGVRSVVVEKDSIGSHASGFAYGGIAGPGGPGPLAPITDDAWRLHNEFAETLPQETGVDTQFRPRATLTLAFDEEEARLLRRNVALRQREGQTGVRWSDAADARAIEPRISPEVVGAMYDETGADVEPYGLVLALAEAAEKLGARIRHGRVIGLRRDGGRVQSVDLEGEEVRCEKVVLAMGPWSGESSSWLGVPIPVRPLKGQILRLETPGPPVKSSVSWNGNYASTKPDGLLWSGTTEEDAGFDETPTQEGRDRIMASLLRMLPSLENAGLVRHTACLRPVSSDGHLVLGEVPGWDGVYLATGAGRQGIRLGPGMALAIVDLITKGSSHISLDAFNPGRFAE